jgi:hypothetical protein
VSSTYTVGKQAAAFRDAAGQSFFILFEQTYESNVHPRTPRWSCTYIGRLPGAVRKIFAHASAAEGGMLRNRTGNMTPESYIESWLRQLTAPVGYPDHPVRLAVGKNLYDAIGDANRPDVAGILAARGRNDLLTALETGAMTVSLYQDAELLEQLHNEGGIPSWRIITSNCCAMSIGDGSLGYAPRPVRGFSVQVPALMRVGEENILRQRDDGSWYCAGWQYSVVSNYVEGLWGSELQEPGSSRKRIEAVGAAAKNAPRVPKGTRLRIEPSPSLSDWQQRAIAEVREEVAPGTAAAFDFELDLSNQDLMWRVTRLPAESATWLIPAQAVPVTPSRQSELELAA